MLMTNIFSFSHNVFSYQWQKPSFELDLHVAKMLISAFLKCLKIGLVQSLSFGKELILS